MDDLEDTDEHPDGSMPGEEPDAGQESGEDGAHSTEELLVNEENLAIIRPFKLNEPPSATHSNPGIFIIIFSFANFQLRSKTATSERKLVCGGRTILCGEMVCVIIIVVFIFVLFVLFSLFRHYC